MDGNFVLESKRWADCLLNGLQELYGEPACNCMGDLELVDESGGSVLCHSVLMASVSPLIRSVLLTHYSQDDTQNPQSKKKVARICLPISSDQCKQIIQFVTHGRIRINSQNIKQLEAAAKCLGIAELVALCKALVDNTQTKTNSADLHGIDAKKLTPDLHVKIPVKIIQKTSSLHLPSEGKTSSEGVGKGLSPSKARKRPVEEGTDEQNQSLKKMVPDQSSCDIETCDSDTKDDIKHLPEPGSSDHGSSECTPDDYFSDCTGKLSKEGLKQLSTTRIKTEPTDYDSGNRKKAKRNEDGFSPRIINVSSMQSGSSKGNAKSSVYKTLLPKPLPGTKVKASDPCIIKTLPKMMMKGNLASGLTPDCDVVNLVTSQTAMYTPFSKAIRVSDINPVTARYECTKCSARFGYGRELFEHEEQHRNGLHKTKHPKLDVPEHDPFTAEQPDSPKRKLPKKVKIRKKKIPKFPFKCNICYQSFSNEDTFKAHEKAHKRALEFKPSQCDKCKREFHFRLSLESHSCKTIPIRSAVRKDPSLAALRVNTDGEKKNGSQKKSVGKKQPTDCKKSSDTTKTVCHSQKGTSKCDSQSVLNKGKHQIPTLNNGNTEVEVHQSSSMAHKENSSYHDQLFSTSMKSTTATEKGQGATYKDRGSVPGLKMTSGLNNVDTCDIVIKEESM